MAITTISSREFNQDVGGAKKAAERGPVFVTDRGAPAHVLLSIAQYQRLVGKGQKIADLLAISDEADVDFEIPASSELARAADLT